MGYETYQAKRTFYRGTWYDSNLEARVAESLDALGVAHEYHRQCFRDARFPWGQYTPDFHLPNEGAYVEVAGVFDERHQRNVATLCDIMGVRSPRDHRVLVVGGGQAGFTMAYRAGGDGLQGVPHEWRAPDGRGSCDLMRLAGVR